MRRSESWRERSGKNFDHRKRWIEDKLKQLSANFGIDLLAFSCLSNHFHLLLRSRPDVVATWDDNQVAVRWWQLCPTRKVKLEVDGQWVKVPAEPTEFELNDIRNDPVGAVGIDSHIPFEGIGIAQAQKATQGLRKLNYVGIQDR